MYPDGPSNIRVFIDWHERTVFAGEDVKCTITFKNVASDAQSPNKAGVKSTSPKHREKQRPISGRAQAASSFTASQGAAAKSTQGHQRSALSLSFPPTAHSRSGSIQWPHAPSSRGGRPGNGHERSVSVVSIGSASPVEVLGRRNDVSRMKSQRPRPHLRAASLQIQTQRPSVTTADARSAPLLRQTSSPLIHTSISPDRYSRPMKPITAPNTPGLREARNPSRRSPDAMPKFRLPAARPPEPTGMRSSDSQQTSAITKTDGLLSPRMQPHDHHNGLGLRLKDNRKASDSFHALVLSNANEVAGTPRSSGEIYSVSNNSSETLASEYIAYGRGTGKGKTLPCPRSTATGSQQHAAPESLIIGYAQVQGTFCLDGSLVQLAPFEPIKKRAAIGGQGGGVIGLEPRGRESGLFQRFGLGSISSSLGDLWGGSELSTIKEMRGALNSKFIPLLSTPQSVLFVDLCLGPGESRAYTYTFKLPRGLPPTHKGKAMKISYSLIIGTQRAGGAKEQQLRSIDVPFRVLGSVNGHGEILGHDLMNPYILLKDEAQVDSRQDGNQTSRLKENQDDPETTLNNFLSYVGELVRRPDAENGASLLSPTIGDEMKRLSGFGEGATAEEAIHLAILRSNLASDGEQSPNRFEIAQNGQRVGVVMLTRPAYRLGEAVTMAIDFGDAEMPCYAVHATLESMEKIDPSLAVRSEASIQRVTRRVYVASSEVTLYSRRIVFTPTIPMSATPEFVTSGISFEWKIRLEFVVPFQGSEGAGPEDQFGPHPLLEQISQDEKGGLVLVGMEHLACESFDVMVPLRVYGAVGHGLERVERDAAAEEGLAV